MAGVICAGVWSFAGGQPQEKPPAFRSSVALATVDAVVVDRDGRHVTDLAAADFELTQSGRPLAVRQAVYVRAHPNGAAAPGDAASPARDLATLGLPASMPRAASIGRTIAVVVDELELSFENMVYARRALHEFIDRQVQPGDLVAILRTAGGVGALQQFTADKRLLRSAAEGVQWTPGGRAGPAEIGGPGMDSLEEFRHGLLAAGALGSLDAAVRGLQHLPGRKALVLLSEGLDIAASRRDARVWSALTQLVDRANRAGVVLYAIDVRGLMYVSPGEGLRRLLASQGGLQYLAEETGGLAVVDNNSIALGLERVLDDQRGYYLIGYEPAGGSGKEGARISVAVKRPGLQVRARRGLFGPSQGEAQAESIDPLELAARSPFGAGDVTLRLTALFGYDQGDGPYVHALLMIDGGDLAFTPVADGYEARVDLLLLAVADNGRVAARWQQQDLVIRLSDEEHRAARERGLVRSVRFLARTAAPYQIRAAVRDRSSGALGSGSQFLIVPKVGEGRLALSGVLMRAVRQDASEPAGGAPPDAVRPFADVLGQPTIRVFRPGTEAVYAFEVYDGLRADEPIATSTTLLRDGREVYRSPATQISSERRRGRFNRIPIGGTLTLGRNLPAGAYVLQVGVGRLRRGQLDVVARQWADFELH